MLRITLWHCNGLSCVRACAFLQKSLSLSTQMVSAGPKMLYAPMLYASHRKRADIPYVRILFVVPAVVRPWGTHPPPCPPSPSSSLFPLPPAILSFSPLSPSLPSAMRCSARLSARLRPPPCSAVFGAALSHSRRRCRCSVKDVFVEAMGEGSLPPKRKYIVLDLTLDDGTNDVVIPQVQFFFE